MPRFFGRVEKIEDYGIEAKSAAEAKALMRKIVAGDQDVDRRFFSTHEVVRWELCRTDGRGDPTEVLDGEGTTVQAWVVDVFGKPVERHIP